MKRTRKLILALVVVMSLLMAMAVAVIPASAAGTTVSDTKIIYFVNRNSWSTPTAYYWGGTANSWPGTKMVKTDLKYSNYDVYAVAVPSNNKNIIFSNNGSNQTADLTIPTNGNNCYNYTSGSWGKYSPTGLNLVVAGSVSGNDSDGGIFTDGWSTTNTANKMIYDSASATYKLTYENAPANTYEFKVTNGTWNLAFPSNNVKFTVEKSCSTVVISFNAVSGQIDVSVTPVHSGGAATCTEQAKCQFCGDPYGSNLGHDMVTDKEKAPTCTETGLTEGSHCSRCDDATTAQEIVDALGHTFGQTTIAVNEDCKNPGNEAYKQCEICELYFGENEGVDSTNGKIDTTDFIIPSTGDHKPAHDCEKNCAGCGDLLWPNADHSIIAVEANAATCTETGNIAYWYCEYCDTCWSDEGLTQITNHKSAIIPKNSHTEAVDAAVAPDCLNTGLTEGKHCSVCNEVLVAQTVVDALGHTNGDAVTENEVAPGCTTDGSHDEVVYCTVCEAEVSRTKKTDKATGHTFVEDKCACGQDKYYTVYFRDDWNWGGNFTAYYWESKVAENPSWPGVEMTLVGTQNYTDGTSRKVYSAKIPYDITGLLFFNNISEVVGDGKTPDITSGWDNCVVFYMFWANKNTVRHDAVYHTHTSEVTNEATCTEAGLKTFTCLCGDTYTEEIPATDHTYVSGKCSACGHEAETFEEAITGTGTVQVPEDGATVDQLTVHPGLVIDLNGHTLTVTGGVVTFDKNQIIDSGKTKGLIKVAKGKLVYTEGGESTLVPVWNEKDGYFLANVTDQFKSDVVESENDDSFSVTFRPSLDKNSDLNLSVFGNGAVGNGIKFIIKITGTNAQGTKDLFVGSVSDSIIAQAYKNNGAIRITVKGADLNEYTEFNVQLIITNDTSLTHTTTICSYTKDNNGKVYVK